MKKEAIESIVGKLLKSRKRTVALAESCTGGLLAHRMTNISGSSSYFKISIIAYSNDAKRDVLKIKKERIEKYGAVSQETAGDMAEEVRNLAKTDIGIGITGIAGPKGGTEKKPVGLVYIALTGKKRKKVKKFRFTGTREEVKQKATTEALKMLRAGL